MNSSKPSGQPAKNTRKFKLLLVSGTFGEPSMPFRGYGKFKKLSGF